jgi:hypothetical protein
VSRPRCQGALGRHPVFERGELKLRSKPSRERFCPRKDTCETFQLERTVVVVWPCALARAVGCVWSEENGGPGPGLTRVRVNERLICRVEATTCRSGLIPLEIVVAVRCLPRQYCFVVVARDRDNGRAHSPIPLHCYHDHGTIHNLISMISGLYPMFASGWPHNARANDHEAPAPHTGRTCPHRRLLNASSTYQPRALDSHDSYLPAGQQFPPAPSRCYDVPSASSSDRLRLSLHHSKICHTWSQPLFRLKDIDPPLQVGPAH